MTQTTKKKKSRLRTSLGGYVLLEVMASGAITATSLAGILIYLAQAKEQTIRGAREQVASTLAQQSIEKFMVLPVGDLTAANFPATETIGLINSGDYTRTHTLTTGTETVAGVSLTTTRVVIAVSFPNGGETRTVTASAKRYQ